MGVKSNKPDGNMDEMRDDLVRFINEQASDDEVVEMYQQYVDAGD
jgi:hypothetical protein